MTTRPGVLFMFSVKEAMFGEGSHKVGMFGASVNQEGLDPGIRHGASLVYENLPICRANNGRTLLGWQELRLRRS